MPNYDFKCTDCEHVFDDLCPVGTGTNNCPKCSSMAHRIWINGPQVMIKGAWKEKGKDRIDDGIPFGDVPGDEDYETIDHNPLSARP